MIRRRNIKKGSDVSRGGPKGVEALVETQPELTLWNLARLPQAISSIAGGGDGINLISCCLDT